jgi:integrase
MGRDLHPCCQDQGDRPPAFVLLDLYHTPVVHGHAKLNPCRLLSKRTRHKLLKPAHDPKKTPHLQSLADVMRVHKALEPFPSIATAFAIGALAGLRTGEVRALRWEHVDLNTNNIHVHVQVERRRGKDPTTWSADGTQTTKGDDGRVVPIFPLLVPILKAAKLATGGKGLVCPPLRERDGGHLSDRTMSSELRTVLKDLKLAKKGLGWYQCTRHTFASLYVLSGGTMEDLQRMMGHSSLLVTMRYAHLRPDHYSASARSHFGTNDAAIS